MKQRTAKKKTRRQRPTVLGTLKKEKRCLQSREQMEINLRNYINKANFK